MLMQSNQTEIVAFLGQEFPQSLQRCCVDAVYEMGAEVRYFVDQTDLRPGGTVSGPSMMTIVDFALYVALLGEIGLVALAVTSQLNIHFLRKPSANQDLRAVCRLMKVGRSLAVGEVWVYSIDQDEPVAHATGSYALPPKV
jgi:acyl-coenzyme A thioesterase PaaI-like protein